ncbi:hypothetical protein [Colwellia psychrerythraea]|uniref:Uncharacterized protein n=1 Tax=Colwellia psychrerythraea TaxID=28229 RepID=A0A099KUF1_COLPS|nr:hypothetical protein [Colwellia psychrerythraea]KGJ93825.1 hypothetical protein GAB14E_2380 [Colwellia psychrerythraea]
MKKQYNIKFYSTVFLTVLQVGCGDQNASDINDISANNDRERPNVNTSQVVTQQLDPIDSATVSSVIDSKKIPVLQSLINQAELVFKGTLIEISNGISIENIPYTFITYNVDDVISGAYQDSTITLKFVGGEYANGNRLTASNSPNIQLGEESVLFVQQGLDIGCDFVQCENGRFLLTDGKVIAANEQAIVVDDNNRIDYISYAAQRDGRHKASLKKQNIPNFISHLKGLGKKSLSQNKIFKNTDKLLPFKGYASLTQAGQAPETPKNILSNKSNKGTAKIATGSPHDQWEVEQLKQNGGDPILNLRSPYDHN